MRLYKLELNVFDERHKEISRQVRTFSITLLENFGLLPRGDGKYLPLKHKEVAEYVKSMYDQTLSDTDVLPN